MRHLFLLAVLVALTLTPVRAQTPATQPLAQRIVRADSAAYRPSPAVHGGAGSMSFAALLNRGAVTPEFNFLHRGVIGILRSAFVATATAFGAGRVAQPARAQTGHIRLYVEMEIPPAREREMLNAFHD